MKNKKGARRSTSCRAKGDLSLPAGDIQWWRDAKYGMFIHWGVYAVPGRGEWLML